MIATRVPRHGRSTDLARTSTISPIYHTLIAGHDVGFAHSPIWRCGVGTRARSRGGPRETRRAEREGTLAPEPGGARIHPDGAADGLPRLASLLLSLITCTVCAWMPGRSQHFIWYALLLCSVW